MFTRRGHFIETIFQFFGIILKTALVISSSDISLHVYTSIILSYL